MENYYNKPALIIMAAGMGSRFGGLKQVTPLGPSGELIIDYSIHDAMEAGFERIVFVIKHEIEDVFKEFIGNRIEKIVQTDYVFQELDALPEGYSVPEGRVKPYGTAHAVWCCKDVVKGPFMVINSDDYYGKDCFKSGYEFITNPANDGIKHLAMAGFILENTLTENGSVSRGVVELGENNKVVGIQERTKIEIRDGKPMFTEDDGATWTELDSKCYVSMNCWGYPAGMFDIFDRELRVFLETTVKENPLKGEFYLPIMADKMTKEGIADITVLPVSDKWFGVTYAEDKPKVMAALKNLADTGVYAQRLWDK
ncbi:MAG: NTP transferase domain-containing protein [Clostridia bacterium]|nr:NTP transferase domain-containing protein [Clostridia bacterium]